MAEAKLPWMALLRFSDGSTARQAGDAE